MKWIWIIVFLGSSTLWQSEITSPKINIFKSFCKIVFQKGGTVLYSHRVDWRLPISADISCSDSWKQHALCLVPCLEQAHIHFIKSNF